MLTGINLWNEFFWPYLVGRGEELQVLPVAQGTGQALRRAHHVITENQRTLDAARALAAGDLATLVALMAASHASMRDDFEITVPAVDRLVDRLVDITRPHSAGAVARA